MVELAFEEVPNIPAKDWVKQTIRNLSIHTRDMSNECRASLLAQLTF